MSLHAERPLMQIASMLAIFAMCLLVGCSTTDTPVPRPGTGSPSIEQPEAPEPEGESTAPTGPKPSPAENVSTPGPAPPTTPPEPTATPSPEEGPAPGPSGITAEELATHNLKSDCWVGYKGVAYDITAWLPRHPGGPSVIARYCGTTDEFTAAFNKRHKTSKEGRLQQEGKNMGTLT